MNEKITTQLEGLTPEEIKYLYEFIVDYVKICNEKLKQYKSISSFMKDLTDLTKAHFDEEDAKTEIVGMNNEDLEEKIKPVKEELKIFSEILKKIQPLVDSL
jgi:hemerythrin